ncbi:MAG TPA: [Fe-Fe] hydrogenase large subunit C-terminal domain-containing protein [Patescibacteria group bacterium]|nr:[Fe-Fe] hydrogenase large subunit C-terminal domain-containing protein [Patescibacteria group bacterium]
MGEYFHSVRLIEDRCQGCVNCTRHCPTEAIRIRGGKALITESRCIDCGECIRHCPAHAKAAVTDGLSDLQRFEYNVALPAPALYGQFSPDVSIPVILCALQRLGFDQVVEVARGAMLVSRVIADYLKQPGVKRPAISSACPAVVKLIQVKFPELLEHLIPFSPPVEVAARLARTEAVKNAGVSPDKVGVWFITPCPAKMTAIRRPLGTDKSHITGAIGMSAIYGDMLKAVSECGAQTGEFPKTASWEGVGWAVSGGETTAVQASNTLVVHGIHHVDDVLEQIVMGRLKNIEYIELLSCDGGCIGGPLTVENHFVAEHRMRQRLRAMQKEEAGIALPDREDITPQLGLAERRVIEPRPVMRLDEDISKAMDKAEVMVRTLKNLPGLDCGSCGSPNCKALAEDIAQGIASETDCVFKLRARVRDLAQEMFDLAEKLPPPLDKK